MQTFDIAIIGNGIIAYSLAFSFIQEQPSLRIAIVGANQTNSATFAAGAMLGCFGEITSSTFRSIYGKEKFEMNLQARKFWPSWMDTLDEHLPPEEQLHRGKGSYVILNSESGSLDSDNFLTLKKALDTYKEPYEEVEGTEIIGFNPKENCRPLRALYLPQEGYVDPSQLCNILVSQLSKNKNVFFINSPADNINTKSDAISSILLTSSEEIAASQIIIAAGAYSQKLINQLPAIKANIPPILSGAGCAVVIEQKDPPISNVIRTPNRAGACGLHVVPRKNNQLYVGATNNIAFSPETNLRLSHINFLLKCVVDQINQDFHNAKIISWHVGNRPLTLDTFPLIGETSLKGLWIVTGTYRDGLHLSPLLAKSIVNEIFYGKSLFKNIFLPERPLIETMPQHQAIEETVKHFMCGAYEHGMELPRIGWDNMLSKLIRNKLIEFYKETNISYGLSPDLFFSFEDEKKHLENFRYYFQKIAQKTNSDYFNNNFNFGDNIISYIEKELVSLP